MSDDDSLPLAALGPVDGQLVSEVSQRVVHFLSYLLIDQRAELQPHFKNLPILPTYPCLAAINTSVSSVVGNQPLLDRLTHFTNNLQHEATEVRAGALHHIYTLLAARRQQLDAYALDGSFAELISRLVSHLLSLCTDASPDVRRLCALCIGELGAIDPAHLSVEVHIATPSRFLSEKEFSLWLIESLLVRAIRSATAIQQQNRASFSVQEILRVHGVDEDTVRIASRMLNKGTGGIRGMRKGELDKRDSVDFWMALSESVRETILPCVTSNYELSTPVVKNVASAGEASVKVEESKVGKVEERKDADDTSAGPRTRQRQAKSKVSPTKDPLPPPAPRRVQHAAAQVVRSVSLGSVVATTATIFTVGQSYGRWLCNWSSQLLECSVGPRRPVFIHCGAVLQRDPHVARELLPYLVDNVIKHGREEHAQAVRAEMLAVLNSIDDVVNPSTALIPPLSTSSNHASSSSTTFVAPSLSPTIQQSAQVIFELIDTLTSWLHEEASAQMSSNLHSSSSSADTNQTAPPRADSPHLQQQLPTITSSSLFCRTIVQRKQLLDSVPRRTLANAAYACHAFTRALKYFESHLREERQTWRKKHNALPPKDSSKRLAVKADEPPLPAKLRRAVDQQQDRPAAHSHVGRHDAIRPPLPAATVCVDGRAGWHVGHRSAAVVVVLAAGADTRSSECGQVE